jgi:hypothetical protein
MNDLAIAIAIILFPGLIATIICDQIALHSPKWRSFKYGVYSFVFGVSCYILLQFGMWISELVVGILRFALPPEFSILHVWTFATSRHASINLGEVLLASLIAPIVAGAATAIDYWKLPTRIAQGLGLSFKYGDENLFSYYLNSTDILWVYIRDPSVNQTYKGRVRDFSESDHIQEIVLSDVEVYTYEDPKKLYDLPTIYLARPVGTFTIEAIPNRLRETSHDQKTS